MSQSNIIADLGPTNTGKTHNALTRLMRHKTGIIGLPLRLLAREIYDKLIEQIPAQELALITGEERIIGAKARYWVATVEAMPLDFSADIVIVDEIQLAADFERGYIFTDRLLNARGRLETLWLGSQAMKPIIQSLFPQIEIESRPRLSTLSYVGRKKLSQLPPRTAIIAFGAEDVYATAELIKRQFGGAAVVMGALSPRTRNAQVEMFQNGEVDYIVATDAIGMGLNLKLRNVFFAADTKFDGRRHRELFVHELAQIAGRAGRHIENGYFGVTAKTARFDEKVVNAIENHLFMPVKSLEWRNSNLDFQSIDALIASLETQPPFEKLTLTREADDLRVLRLLSKDQEINDRLHSKKDIELLWSVCQLPDFPKFSAGEHVALVSKLFFALTSEKGMLDEAFVENSIETIARPHHNIEILGRKLSQIRTWSYIATRKNWLDNRETWRKRARDVEDSLSDALHKGLVESFVDRRTSHLRRKMKDKETFMAEVSNEGVVTIDDQFVGNLKGFQFQIDPKATGDEAKTIQEAVKSALKPLLNLRADKFYNSADTDFSLTSSGAVEWKFGEEIILIARLEKGTSIRKPAILLLSDNLDDDISTKLSRRLEHWLDRKLDEIFAPILAIEADESLEGLAKGVGFQLTEALGVIPRQKIADDIKSLDQDARASLRKRGVRFGQYTIFVHTLLKPASVEWRMRLLSLWNEEAETPEMPGAGLVTIEARPDFEEHHYTYSGYKLLGARAIRVDMLERLANLIREKDRTGFEADQDMLSITGLSLEGLANLLDALGFEGERGERVVTKQIAKKSEDTTESAEVTVNTEEVAQEKKASEEVENTTETQENTVAEDEKIEIFYTFRQRRRTPKPSQTKPKSRGQAKNNKTANTARKSKKHVKPSKPIDPDNPFAALMALKK